MRGNLSVRALGGGAQCHPSQGGLLAGSYGGHAVATAMEEELEGLHCTVLFKAPEWARATGGSGSGEQQNFAVTQNTLQKDVVVEELSPLEPLDLAPLLACGSTRQPCNTT